MYLHVSMYLQYTPKPFSRHSINVLVKSFCCSEIHFGSQVELGGMCSYQFSIIRANIFHQFRRKKSLCSCHILFRCFFFEIGMRFASFQLCGTCSFARMSTINSCSFFLSFIPPCFQISAGIPQSPGTLFSRVDVIAVARSSKLRTCSAPWSPGRWVVHWEQLH